MARAKISEFQAKSILLPHYNGVALTSTGYLNVIKNLPLDLAATNLVLKVDQGIKKRGLQGLVKVNLTKADLVPILKQWISLGWSNFLLEPVLEHSPEAEQYLAVERARDGWHVSYSAKGGIDVESSWDSVQRTVLSPQGLTLKEEPNPTDIFKRREGQTLKDYLVTLIPLMEQNHLVFLEMNPIVIRGTQAIPLDMACEVDDVASPLTPIPDKNMSESERQIATLDASTPASLKFKLINPEGSIWALLSGGGASLVLADEVADQGMGPLLANYGEYSGAPTDDDVYSYTKIILHELLKVKPQTPKALVIAAGIANFTDVAKTFKGIIRAMNDVKSELKQSRVKVFVRRGGPNEARGLAMMKDFLTSAGIPHIIHPHTIPLTQVINDVKSYLGSPLPKRRVLTGTNKI